ncbi:MAG: pyridoxamine 5'-phosphate oxidase family protein [Phycisphaeraceae bacterium]
MLEPEIRDEVARFLGDARVAGLATVDDAGLPHAANLWYASDADWRLYWVSNPASAHSRHLVGRPGVALTIYAHTDQALQLHGLQIQGAARALAPGTAEARHALATYARKYPLIAASALFKQRISGERFYEVTPRWLRWIDNRRGFGFKVDTVF